MGYNIIMFGMNFASRIACCMLAVSSFVAVAVGQQQHGNDAIDHANQNNRYGQHKFSDDHSIIIRNQVSADRQQQQRRLQQPRSTRRNNSEEDEDECSRTDESLWRFDLTTDAFPWETKWRLYNPRGERIDSGPPDGENYQRNESYAVAKCLVPGRYTLRVRDKQGDGICCSFGNGSYKSTVNGEVVAEYNYNDDEGGGKFKKNDYTFKVVAPTMRPTPPPTIRKTEKPTREPTPVVVPGKKTEPEPEPAEPEVVISFIMIGDVPYHEEERYCLNQQLRSLNPTKMHHPYKFIVHVGDMKTASPRCHREQYSDIAEIFAHETNQLHYDARDVFFLIGDNDWSDCVDNRDAAMSYWMNNFGNGKKDDWRNDGVNPHGFGTFSNSKGGMARSLEYDNRGEDSDSGSAAYQSSASNFVFFRKRILFVGINQVGAYVGDEATRVANNFQWVKRNMAKYGKDRLKTVVVFAHADMDGPRWEHFGKPFRELLREDYPDVFILYAHGDWHSFDVNRVDKDNANIIDLSCDSGKNAEPLLVSITRDPSGGRDGLIVDRRGGRYNDECDAGDEEKTWGSENW